MKRSLLAAAVVATSLSVAGCGMSRQESGNTAQVLQNFNNTVQNNSTDFSKFNSQPAPIGRPGVDVYHHRGF